MKVGVGFWLSFVTTIYTINSIKNSISVAQVYTEIYFVRVKTSLILFIYRYISYRRKYDKYGMLIQIMSHLKNMMIRYHPKKFGLEKSNSKSLKIVG